MVYILFNNWSFSPPDGLIRTQFDKHSNGLQRNAMGDQKMTGERYTQEFKMAAVKQSTHERAFNSRPRKTAWDHHQKPLQLAIKVWWCYIVSLASFLPGGLIAC